MHQTVLAQRQAAATQRIIERGQALTRHLELDPALAERLEPVGIKDRLAADMMRLEAVADLLTALAENAGVDPVPVTAVTVNEFVAPAAQPDQPAPVLEESAEPIPESKPADETIPAPVLDEPPTKKPTRGRSKK